MRQLIALAALALGACSPSETFRYRVTVEVDTPQGLKTGSSVWEVAMSKGSGIPDTALRAKERGSAVAVDLPTGTLFALMKGQDYRETQRGNFVTDVIAVHVSRHGYPDIHPQDDWRDGVREIRRAKPNFEMYPDEYPMLVRFADDQQPATVAKVDPADLAASFGPGVRLRRITIAFTNDRPDVHALDERLPWISSTASLIRPPDLDRDQWPFGSSIHGGDFKRNQN